VAVTLVAVSCYFVFDDLLSIMVYFGTELMLLSAMAVVVVAAGVRFQRLRFARRDAESLLDRSLIVVAVFGVLVLDLFHLVSALNRITDGGVIAVMWLVTSVVSCIQVRRRRRLRQ